MKDTVSLRDYIESIISENPGIHFREIQRKSGAAIGQLEYHLYQLERMEKVSIRKDGKLKRYFLIGDTGFNERRILYFLRKGTSKEIILYLLENGYAEPGMFVTGRRTKREKIQETIKDLIEQGIVQTTQDGGRKMIYLSESDKIKSLLKRFRESFLDSLTSNVLSLLE